MSNEARYYDALKQITKYMSPEQIRRDDIGLSYVEYLEMAYENIISVAKTAVRNRRRPKEKSPS